MFLPNNLNFNNKYFFINFLRFVFSQYDYILFFNILKHSNRLFYSVRVLRFTDSLNAYVLNSKVIRSYVKTATSVRFLPGVHLIVYSNSLKDITNFLSNSKVNHPNFLPFTILFKKFFILLDDITVSIFLLSEKKINNLMIFFIVFSTYLAILRYAYTLISNFMVLGLKRPLLK